MLKAVFLGTGAAGGCPRPDHSDSQCIDALKAGSKSARCRSSVFVVMNRAKILIDSGPDILKQLSRAKILRLDAVLLTHDHRDAANGLELLDAWIAERGMKVPLYVHPEVLEKIKMRGLKNLDPRPAEPGRRYCVGGASFMPFSVFHGIKRDVPTLGFRVDGLVYASDMEGAPPESYRMMRCPHALVVDGTFWSKKSLPGHQTVEEAVALGSRVCATKVFLTQIGHAYPPHDEAQRCIDACVRGMKIPFPVKIAYDGMTIRI